mgnify:CR=1 FL=1
MEPNDDPQQNTKTKTKTKINSLTNNLLTHSLTHYRTARVPESGLDPAGQRIQVKVSELEDGIMKGLVASEGDITEDVAR